MLNDSRPSHLDLFSGLGGFAIAAQWAGFRTVAFCENDERCRSFLGRTWGLPIEPDIRTFDGRKYRGVSLLTGGPPCQPASRAGEQRGEADDRWLWGEALRVLAEAEPDSVVFENPPGILDVGIDGILSEMGRLGYETQVFDIPACAVDSPQLRHRIWIVGFMGQPNEKGRKQRQQRSEGPRYWNSVEPTTCLNLADAAKPGREGADAECGADGRPAERGQIDVADTEQQEGQRQECSTHGLRAEAWSNLVWVSCADGKVRRAPDDSFSLVDGLHRSLLGALGNSIVPQVAFEILTAIKANRTNHERRNQTGDNP
jgi:DNA (cytosine-5)-methyltransferase 1